jgi:uncharacterized cupin superfamily protein
VSTPFDLDRTYVHLGSGATATALPDFSWDEECLAQYTATHIADGDEGRLVMISGVSASWKSWERHPAGDEVVVLLSGRITLFHDLGGREQAVEVRPGQAIINPKDVWHTCDVHEPGRALYITPGRGTEHRPRG